MKKVVIYGLPRSGTNFLEYLVVNNMLAIYGTSMRACEYIPGHENAVKHCKPSTDDGGDVYLIIVKNRKNWLRSFIEYQDGRGDPVLRGVARWKGKIAPNPLYDRAAQDYLDFYLSNDDRCAVVWWEDLYRHPETIIRKLGRMFDIPVKPTFTTTDKIVRRGIWDSTYDADFDPDRFDLNWDFDKSKAITELKRCAVR